MWYNRCMYTGGRCRKKEEYLLLKDLKTINKVINIYIYYGRGVGKQEYCLELQRGQVRILNKE